MKTDAVDDDGRSKANDVDFETLLRAVQVQLHRRPCSWQWAENDFGYFVVFLCRVTPLFLLLFRSVIDPSHTAVDKSTTSTLSLFLYTLLLLVSSDSKQQATT